MTLAFLLLIIVNCKAQTQAINILDKGNYMYRSEGQYYQDIDFVLNPFEGEWLYTNGDTTLKIILLKKINHFNSVYHEDVIIGGYEYKVGNNIIISNLAAINTDFLNPIEKSIAGNFVINNNGYPPCSDCSVGEKRLNLTFSEFASNIYGDIIIRKIEVSGQEAIKIIIRGTSGKVHVVGTPLPPADFMVPSGVYTLIKQL